MDDINSMIISTKWLQIKYKLKAIIGINVGKVYSYLKVRKFKNILRMT